MLLLSFGIIALIIRELFHNPNKPGRAYLKTYLLEGALHNYRLIYQGENIMENVNVIKPGTTLKGEPPYRPKIPGPGAYPPETGRMYTELFTVHFAPTYPKFSPTGPGITTQIRKYQFWKLIYSTDLKCGQQNGKLTTKHKVGVSKTQLKEISAGLNLSVANVGANIGGKLGTSITLSEEKEVTYEVPPVKAPKCGGKIFVVWQLVWRYEVEITVKGEYSPKTNKYAFEDNKPIYTTDSLIYKREDCPNCSKTAYLSTVSDDSAEGSQYQVAIGEQSRQEFAPGPSDRIIKRGTPAQPTDAPIRELNTQPSKTIGGVEGQFSTQNRPGTAQSGETGINPDEQT
ncbi:MAG: hypothetical protein ACR2RB_03630 [Gammaproteobacteria bacterium]